MDEYEAALSLFLHHYYTDMAASALVIQPPKYSPLTVAAARLCRFFVPQNHQLPSMVNDVLIGHAMGETL